MEYFAPPSLLMDLPAGKAGTRRTLQIMHNLTMQGKTSPMIRQLATTLVSRLPDRAWLQEVQAIHEFVRDRIRYVRDVNHVETLQTADRTLLNGSGDCDDQSVLLASLLESIGQPTRFIAVAFKPGQFAHVYVQVKPGGTGEWLGAETILPKPLGWNPPGVVNYLILDNAT